MRYLFPAFICVCVAHLSEHIAQAIQVYALNMPLHEAGGILGSFYPRLVHSEVLHYGYAAATLVGRFAFLNCFTGAGRWWWMLGFGIQVWHHFEHALLLWQESMDHNFFGAAGFKMVRKSLILGTLVLPQGSTRSPLASRTVDGQSKTYGRHDRTARRGEGIMILCWGKIRRVLFGIRLREITFVRRGFHVGAVAAKKHLEQIGRTFLDGYHAGLEESQLGRLLARLDAFRQESRGFAFEGAAMALSLLDHLLPGRRNRLATFLNGPGRNQAYMVHVGVGWAAARLGGPMARWREPLDPLLCWLAVDGFGFHEGYFRGRHFLAGSPVPPHLRGYECCVFDQGLGRSLWFVCGADVDALARVIARFLPRRRPDLWSGVGLACAYAGEANGKAIRMIAEASGLFRSHLAQGVAFAAKARERAGNPTEYTEEACQVICGLSAHDAARVTDAALQSLLPEGPEPAYEVWRRRIQRSFSGSRIVALAGAAEKELGV